MVSGLWWLHSPTQQHRHSLWALVVRETHQHDLLPQDQGAVPLETQWPRDTAQQVLYQKGRQTHTPTFPFRHHWSQTETFFSLCCSVVNSTTVLKTVWKELQHDSKALNQVWSQTHNFVLYKKWPSSLFRSFILWLTVHTLWYKGHSSVCFWMGRNIDKRFTVSRLVWIALHTYSNDELNKVMYYTELILMFLNINDKGQLLNIWLALC